MKRLFRNLTFFALFLTSLLLLSLSVSAAQTSAGATDANYMVDTDSGTAYYTTLAEAVAAVKDDGKITVLQNVEGETGVDLTKTDGFTFTITGGDSMKTITFSTAATTANTSTFLLEKGNVTFDNIEIKCTYTAGVKDSRIFHLTGNSNTDSGHTLTLNNIKVDSSTAGDFYYMVWMHQTYRLVISGENTVINAEGKQIVRSNNATTYSSVSVTGGTLTGYFLLQGVNDFSMTGGTLNGYIKAGDINTVYYLTTGGARKTKTNALALTASTNNFAKRITVEIGGDAKIISPDSPVFYIATPTKLTISDSAEISSSTAIVELTANSAWVSTADSSVLAQADITMNGGNLILNEACVLVNSAASSHKISFASGSFTSAGIPDVGSYDVSGIDLVLPDFQLTTLEIASKVSVASQADMDALIKAAFDTAFEDADLFKSVVFKTGVSLDNFLGKWIPFVIVSGGELTISYGCTAESTTTLFKVQGGTLNITGGTYICGAAKPIEVSAAGKVNLTGGTFTTTATYAVHATGKNCTINVENATITTTKTIFYPNSGAAGTVYNIKSGTFTGKRAVYAYIAATFNISGGKFISNATKEQYEAEDVYFLHLPVGGVTLNISGGEFIANEYTDTLLVCNDKAATDARVINLTGGYFEGAKRWVFINQLTEVVIDGATFNDKNAVLGEDGAFRVRNNGNTELVSITVKSGSFTIPESTHSPLFWLEEGILTVLDGDFDIYRLVKIDHISNGTGGSFTVNGGTFKISSSKAIQAYHAGSAKFDLTINGGMFILPHEDAMLVNRADAVGAPYATFKTFTVNAVSVLAKSPDAVLWDDVMINAIDPAKVKYAGEIYYTYFKSVATDASVDIATTDDAFKGASVMVTTTSDVNGIRFYTVIPDSVIATLKGMTYESISFGTIITPAEYVTAAGAFTVEALEKLSVKGDKYANIPTKYSMRDADGDGIPESYSAALINLKTVNYDRVFAAISYVLIDGKYYYGSYNMTDNARSIEEVALTILKSSDYEEGQLNMLTAYAGFTPEAADVVATTFTAGKVDVTGKKLVATDGYVTSGVIHLAKKGSVLVVADKDGSFAGSDTYVISRWTADGTALDEPYVAYDGTSSEIVTTVGTTRYYTYVSTYDNEYVRVSCKGDGTDIEISVREAGRRGTLMQNSAAYTTYVRDAYILDSIKETYHEELEGLHIVGIAPSTLDNKAIAGNLWIDLLADKYNMTLDNHSVSGSTIANDLRELPTNHSSYEEGSTRAVNSFVERLSNPSAKKGFSQTPNPDVDIVFICGGGNDLTRGIGIGEISLDNTDTATLCGAINFCIAKIKELFPNALILSETTTPSSLSYTFDYNEGEEPFTMTRVEYYQKVKEIMSMHGIVSFDFLDESLTGTNIASEAFREQYYMDPDDVKHMNIEGMKMWMPLEEAFIAGEYKKFLASK